MTRKFSEKFNRALFSFSVESGQELDYKQEEIKNIAKDISAKLTRMNSKIQHCYLL